MKTPQTMHEVLGRAAGIVPSATQSATALATAYCAGPNIWTACFIPLIVTLVIRIVAGFTSKLGARTASRFECPSDWFARALAKASADGSRLRADHQVDVGDLVSVAREGLADEHRVVGHWSHIIS